jgi:Cu-Zn family superoxide dismutase
MRIIAVSTLACVIMCSGAAAQENRSGPAAKAVTVDIKDAKSQSVGKAVFSAAQPHGVKLDLTITNLPPGKHAFHIHQRPDCDQSEEFNTAGLQYDPTGEMYGNDKHAAHTGPAAGDPGTTVEVGSNGKGHLTLVFHKLTMGDDDHSIFAKGGTAMIFHAAPGAPGPTRIACAVIIRPN